MDLFGDLFIVHVQRIPDGQNYDDPISASNGSIKGPRFKVGIVHANNNGKPHYYIIHNGEVVLNCNALSATASRVLDLLMKEIPVAADEAIDLLTAFCVDEETIWNFDEIKWIYQTGCGAELFNADSSFDGGIAVSILPVYDTTIEVSGCGVYEGDPSDRYEFGGLRRP